MLEKKEKPVTKSSFIDVPSQLIVKFKKVFLKSAKIFFKKTFEAELKIFTHLTFSEKYLLHRIAKKLPQKSICVEIGSYLGSSTCFIAAGISNGSKLYCIDTWGNQNMNYVEIDTDAKERDTFEEFNSNTKKYRNKIIKLRKWSTEAVNDLKKPGIKVDFLFLDGDHNYEGVKKDWDLYKPLLNKSAIIAFHDTEWAAGVKRVIKEDVLPCCQLVEKLLNLEVYRINI